MRKFALSAALTATLAIGTAFAQTSPLNVPCDPTRELYKDFNAAFGKRWQEKTGQQAKAVRDGLDADVLQRLQPAIVRQAEILPPDTVDRPEPLFFEFSGIDNANDLAAARPPGIQLGLGRLFGAPAADCRPPHNEHRVAYNSPTPTGVTP